MNKDIYKFVSKEFLVDNYISNQIGIPKIIDIVFNKFQIKTSVGFIYNRLKQYGIPIRNSSKARKIIVGGPNYEETYLNQTKEWIDGFLLGDGGADLNYKTQVARFTCGVEYQDFCIYLMSGLKKYYVSEPKHYIHNKESGSGFFSSSTRFHPDLFRIAQNWYKNGKKIMVPDDVIISPVSILLWYLGDGTCIINNKHNSISVRLSTDCFYRKCIEQVLIPKLKILGIDCYCNNDNRICISSKGILNFFHIIGKESPIKCYSYKFNLPMWRFISKRLSVVSKELSVSYGRLSHLIKTGKIGCMRLSKNGRPFLLPEHIEQAKNLISTKELY